jgi:enoyl-CoA hydratase/carnithine racemase
MRVDRRGAVAVVLLNRPEQRNALTAEMKRDLIALWDELAEDRSVRAVVVTGAGSAFCSGADLKALDGDRHVLNESIDGELSFLPGGRLEVPVIVAVNGVCAGLGLQFVADADIALASEDATFIDPHVSVGHVSALEPYALGARIPPAVLARMVLMGRSERLSSERALVCGLVTEVVAPDRLLQRSIEVARAVCEGSPAALRRSRQILRLCDAKLRSMVADEVWSIASEHWSHPDAVEGPKAYAERRPPEWFDA